MRFRLVAVGKVKDKALASAIEMYETRAARYWPLDIVELRDEGTQGRSPDEVRRREAERITAKLGARVVVACEERGDAMSSIAFAKWLRLLQEGAADVEFVIGGAFGLDDSIRARASRLLSLAPWTLSHELARLVFAEQLYRAGTIVRGESYHK